MKFWSAPKIMWGLDRGDGIYKAVRLELKGKTATLTHVHWWTRQDQDGNLIAPPYLEDSEPMAFSLNVDEARISVVSLPQMSKHDIYGAVRMAVRGEVPVPIEEAVVDYYPGELVSPDGQKNRYTVVCGIKEMVNETATRSKTTGLHAIAAEPELTAVVALLADMKKVTQDRAGLVVDIGAQRTVVAALRGDLVIFRREVLWGHWGPHVGPPPGGNPWDINLISEDSVRELLMELDQTVDFFRGEERGAQPEFVYLTGSGAMMEELPSTIQRFLDIEVEVINPLDHIQVSKHVEQDQPQPPPPALAIAIGLALREIQRR